MAGNTGKDVLVSRKSGKPLRIWVAKGPRQAKVVKAIEHLGGTALTGPVNDAQYALLDKGAPDLYTVWQDVHRQRAKTEILDAQWVFDCKIQNNRLEKQQYVILQPKEPPRKATRTAFTAEEDEALAKFLYKQGMGKSGTAVYGLMEKQYPNHSLQSWRERYKNNKNKIEALIQVYSKIVEKRRDDHEDVIFSDDEEDRVTLQKTASTKGKGKAKEQEKGKKTEIPPPRLKRTTTRDSLSPRPSVAAIFKHTQVAEQESQEKDELESQNRASAGASRSASPEVVQPSKKRKRLSGPQPLEFADAEAGRPDETSSVERPGSARQAKKQKIAHTSTVASGVAPTDSPAVTVPQATASRDRFLPSTSPILDAEESIYNHARRVSSEVPEPPRSARETRVNPHDANQKAAKRNPLLSRTLPASLHDITWTSKHLYTLLSMSQFDNLQHACSGSEQIAFDLAQQLAKGSQSIINLHLKSDVRRSFWTPEEDEVVLALLRDEDPDAKEILLDTHGSEKVEKRKAYLSNIYKDNLSLPNGVPRCFPFA